MSDPSPPPDRDSADSAESKAAPLSLNRLTAAFAQMLGTPAAEANPAGGESESEGKPTASAAPATDPCEIGVRSIVESVLFVGSKEATSRSAEELAQAMRDVSPEEVELAVDELNERYQRDAAPYEIVVSHAGYRLALREEFSRMRDKFHGRVKEAKLSPAALEVLSVVAYRQPVLAATVDELRGVKSGTLLAQLVRRGVIRIDRETPPAAGPKSKAMTAQSGTDSDTQSGTESAAQSDTKSGKSRPKGAAHYYTTDRFLKLFELQNLSQLPQVAELEDG